MVRTKHDEDMVDSNNATTNAATKVATILVVDDEEVIAGLLKKLLSKAGHTVYTAATGAEALELARQHQPKLILMDISMPEMDGYEATARIKEDPALANTPVIFLTGKSAGEDGGRAFAKGGLTYIRKPFNNQQIQDLVNLALQSI